MDRLPPCMIGIAAAWIFAVSAVQLVRFVNEAMLLVVLWRVLP